MIENQTKIARKKTLKELKRTDPKSMLEDVLRECPRHAERLDEACNSRPIHNETVAEEPKPQIFCTDWLRAQPLLGELDFETDCHFPGCRAKTKQGNHNFCRGHHRYFNRVQLTLRRIIRKRRDVELAERA